MCDLHDFFEIVGYTLLGGNQVSCSLMSVHPCVLAIYLCVCVCYGSHI